MMTIVTHVRIEPGKEPGWDDAFRKRASAAKRQPGWIGVQLCIPSDAVNERIVIGTWDTRADWERWHTRMSSRAPASRWKDSRPKCGTSGGTK